MRTGPIPIRNVVSGPAEPVTRPWVQFFQSIRDALSKAAEAPAECTQATLPTLTTADTGRVVWVTDYRHFLRWTGAAWEWAPGELGSGYLGWFSADPGTGWKLINGAAITYLKADGTTAVIAIGDMRDDRYVKGGAAFTGAQIAAVATGTPSATVTAGAGGAVTAASGTHTHAVPGEPKSMAWLPYFRV